MFCIQAREIAVILHSIQTTRDVEITTSSSEFETKRKIKRTFETLFNENDQLPNKIKIQHHFIPTGRVHISFLQ